LSENDWFHDALHTEEGASEDGCYNEKPTKSRFRWTALFFHLALVTMYSVAFISAIRGTSKNGTGMKHLIKSPLHEAIEVEPKVIHASLDNKNPFKGPPSDELDHAWNQLFVNSHVRVTEEDLAKINRTSVPILDERGGYYVIPDVYHQLHCLKFLRRVIYKDYYHLKNPFTPIHVDHCIDNLRQNLMCKGDVSLLTFSWVSDDRAPEPNFEIEHECVNWVKLDNWAKEHSFDLFDEKLLVHPTLGPSFPKAEYKNRYNTGIPGFPP